MGSRNLFDVTVRPNWESHTLDLSDDDEARRALNDISAGRDASIFGKLPSPWRFEVRAFGKTISGTTDTFEDLASAAQIIKGSNLSEEDKVETWKSVVSAELERDETFYSVAEDLVDSDSE